MNITIEGTKPEHYQAAITQLTSLIESNSGQSGFNPTFSGVDAEGSEVTFTSEEFFGEVEDAEITKEVEALSKALIAHGGSLRISEEEPYGLTILSNLAVYNAHYIPLFRDYVLSLDLEHVPGDLILDAFDEIRSSWNWRENTYDLYTRILFYSTELLEAYPYSLAQWCSDNPDQEELLFESLAKNRELYRNESPDNARYADDFHDEWLSVYKHFKAELNRTEDSPFDFENDYWDLLRTPKEDEILEVFQNYPEEIKERIEITLTVLNFWSPKLFETFFDIVGADAIREVTTESYNILEKMYRLPEENQYIFDYLHEKGALAYKIKEPGQNKYNVTPLIELIESVDHSSSQEETDCALKKIRGFIERGGDINEPVVDMVYGTVSPLFICLKEQRMNYDVLHLLLELGADIHFVRRDSDGNISSTLLTRILYRLEKKKNDYNSSSWPLVQAMRPKMIALFKEWVEQGVPVKPEGSYNLLEQALDMGDREMLEYLWSTGHFDFSAKVNGLSILRRAAQHLSSIEFLIEKGADLSDESIASDLLSDAKKDTKIMDALLKGGFLVDVPDSSGNTPLLNACSKMKVQSIRKLLHFGADKNARNNKTSKPENDLNEYDYENGQNWLACLREEYLNDYDGYFDFSQVIAESVKEDGFGKAKARAYKKDRINDTVSSEFTIEDYARNHSYNCIVSAFEEPSLTEYFSRKYSVVFGDIDSYKSVITDLTAFIADTKEFKAAARANDGVLRFFLDVDRSDGGCVYDVLSDAVTLGIEDELFALFDLLVEFDEPIYGRPFSIFGLSALIKLIQVNDQYLERFGAFVATQLKGEDIRNLYDYHEELLSLITTRKDRGAMAVIVKCIDADIGIDIYFLTKILGKEGELFDLFWKTYEELAPDTLEKTKEEYFDWV